MKQRQALDQSHFRVKGLLGNTHVQSLLASSKVRRHLKSNNYSALIANQRSGLFDGGDGIRLHAYYSLHSGQEHPGNNKLVIMIHGWEGSADSTYLLSAASALFNEGYAILRLHLRDHGPSTHLNRELFHAARLDEVIHAIKDAQMRFPAYAFYLVGFSLGGNFALRISQRAREKAIFLQHVVAVSPVFSPAQTMQALEMGPAIYRAYFLKKWKRALQSKQSCFPELYNFQHLNSNTSLMNITEHLVTAHTHFDSVDDYFDSYTLQARDFEETSILTDVILAADDPVIPLAGTEAFSSSHKFRLRIFPKGGHCGFIQNWRFESWLDNELIRLFSSQEAIQNTASSFTTHPQKQGDRHDIQ